MGILSGIIFIPAMHIGKFNRKARLIQVLIVTPIMLAVFIIPYAVFYSVCNQINYISHGNKNRAVWLVYYRI